MITTRNNNLFLFSQWRSGTVKKNFALCICMIEDFLKLLKLNWRNRETIVDSVKNNKQIIILNVLFIKI